MEVAIAGIAFMVGLVASAIAIYEFAWPILKERLLKRSRPEPATRQDIGKIGERIKQLEAKLTRTCEYQGGLADTIDKRLKAAYEEARVLQLEGYEAQSQHKHREAVDRFSRALDLAENSCQRAALHNMRGNSYLILHEFQKAEHDCERVLELSEDIPNGQTSAQMYAAALGNLGIIHINYGNLDIAESYVRRALEIQSEIDDVLCQGIGLASLGDIYNLRGSQEDAQRYYEQALEKHREIGNQPEVANVLTKLGVVHARQSNADKAVTYCTQSVDLYRHLGLPQGEASALGNLGYILGERGEVEKAKSYLEQSLAIHVSIGDCMGQAHNLGNLGLLLLGLDTERARYYLQQAQFIYEALNAQGEGPEAVRQALKEL